MTHDRIYGLLLGTVVADAIGLPMEGMTPQKIQKLGWADQLKHRFILGHGMWSDDSEHCIMLTQSIISSCGDVDRFRKSFAWELRWWILGLPAASGLATGRSIAKLWLGFPSTHSGVFSAGNGSAMRTAAIAAAYPHDPEKRRAYVDAHTRITHSDPKAYFATLAITEVAALLLTSDSIPSPEAIWKILRSCSADTEWLTLVETTKEAYADGSSISELLGTLGGRAEKGVSGYVYQTIPAALLAGLRHDWNYEGSVREIISAGGDTDTTAAIVGALCGAQNGAASIPQSWKTGVTEFPTSLASLERLATALAAREHTRDKPHVRIRPRWSPLLLLRNLFFLGIVLIHGLSRLLPAAVLKDRS